MGTFYRSRHQLIFAFKNGTAQHQQVSELGQQRALSDERLVLQGRQHAPGRPDG